MALPSFIELHKKGGEDEGDSWLLSYSDMMSLLLSFFVVLVSFSSINLVKVEMMTQHFAKQDRMTYKELQQYIQEFINSENLKDEVGVKLTEKGVEISFKDKLLFDLGKADLKPRALSILSKIAGLLNYREIAQRKILVEGHTDSLPIKSEIYPSNWELSSARAGNVVRFLTSLGLDSRRFESIGYADTQPIKPEVDKIIGQPENRRVVVVITPESYLIKRERKEISVSDADKTLLKNSTKNRLFSLPYKSKNNPSSNTIVQNKNNTQSSNTSKRIPGTSTKSYGTNKNKRVMENYFVLGQQYFKKKDYKEAIKWWKKVLKLDPTHQLTKINIQRAKKELSKK